MIVDWPVLSALIWLPIVAGVLLLVIGEWAIGLGRWLALAASLVTLAMGVVLWQDFDRRGQALTPVAFDLSVV